MPPIKRKLTAVPDQSQPQHDPAPDLRSAVAAAIKDMGWLSTSDKALAALAMRQAQEIETAIDRAQELADLYRADPDSYKRLQKLEAMCDVTKTVGWLGPQLQGVLRDLGGTPAARKAMGEEKPTGGRLAQIRKDAAARKDDA
jgi:transposase